MSQSSWTAMAGGPPRAGDRARRPRGRRGGAPSSVEAAPLLGVATLTVYAFSSDNWSRPAVEVAALLRLMRRGIGDGGRSLRAQRCPAVDHRAARPAARRHCGARSKRPSRRRPAGGGCGCGWRSTTRRATRFCARPRAWRRPHAADTRRVRCVARGARPRQPATRRRPADPHRW